jgi:uncharacterized spore protein YtfJ
LNCAERLLKNTVEELDRLLSAKNGLVDPIKKDGSTVIPIVSYGFGFGAGGTKGARSGSGGGPVCPAPAQHGRCGLTPWRGSGCRGNLQRI